MRTILVGDCAAERLFQLNDPDAPNEAQFELDVARALSCIYRNHHCIVFSGTFSYQNENFAADLALIARDFSHWFIIEVELVSHSFEHHVLPQVISFRYGEPQSDCLRVLARELSVSLQRAQTLLEFVPRGVAVIANKYNRDWEVALRSHGIQFLTVSRFQSSNGTDAIEINGSLAVKTENLGFGKYSAMDRSLILPRDAKLPLGPIQIGSTTGAVSTWIVNRDDSYTWIRKETGIPDIPDGAFVQIVRSADGRLSFPHY